MAPSHTTVISFKVPELRQPPADASRCYVLSATVIGLRDA